MIADVAWRAGDEAVVIAVGVATLCYCAYHLGAEPSVVARVFPEARTPAQRRTARAFWRRGWGAVLLGIVPLMVAIAWLPGGAADYGFSLANAGTSLAIAAATLAVLLPLIWRQSRRPWFTADYPEVRAQPWTPRVRRRNAASWALYLVAYELFFRGFLLVPLAVAFGVWPAIAVMTACYAFVHLGKNAAETLGAIPIGVLYGVVALHTGSLLMPIIVHWVTAVAADELAARHAASAPSSP